MSGLCTRIDNLDVTLIEWQKSPALRNNARKMIELAQFPIKPVRIISHSNQIYGNMGLSIATHWPFILISVVY